MLVDQVQTISPENLHDKYHIDMEFGYHTDGTKVLGDYDWYYSSLWSEGIKKRALEGNYKVLGIDSLTMREDEVFGAKNVSVQSKIWQCLHLNPGEINDEGRVFLPTVDFNAYDETDLEVGVGKAVYDCMFNLSEAYYRKQEVDILKIATALITGTTVVATGSTISILKDKEVKRNGLSRRSFLGLAATAGLGIIAGANLGKAGLMTIVDHPIVDISLKDKIIKLVGVLDGITFDVSKLTKGRTAAIIERTKETMDHLDLDPKQSGLTIMGNAHMIGVAEFQQSRDARLEAMASHVRLVKGISDVCGNALNINPNRYLNTLMENYLAVRVYQATDPRNDPYFPHIRSVNNSINIHSTFVSDSTLQVLTAEGLI